MEGIKAYTLFAPGSIEGCAGQFPGNTVVYVDEASGEIRQVSPLGTPYSADAAQQDTVQREALDKAPVEEPIKVSAAADERVGG